jgi:hypothetical protein
MSDECVKWYPEDARWCLNKGEDAQVEIEARSLYEYI